MRDTLTGRATRDLDWLVGDPEREARSAAERLGGTAFALDAARGHWRTVGAGQVLDYAPLIASGTGAPLLRDLGRRDFTVDAIAADLSGRLHDPLGGIGDLFAGRLRMTTPASLAADPLRPLRGARLAATLGLQVEERTLAEMLRLGRRQAEGDAPLPAWERVLAELDRLLADRAAGRGLALASDLGILAWALPELSACDGVVQGGFHHLDVLQHSLEALQRLVSGFPDSGLALRWATLLHDIGKPLTRERGDDGRIRFYGHAREGARLAEAALGRLRAPAERRRRVARLIARHMVQLPADDRAARRFVHRRRELLPDLLELMVADREAARGPLSSEASRRAYRTALSRVLAILAEEPAATPLFGGDDVMRVLRMGPGPRIGEALRLLREAEAVGDIGTREEAEELLRRYADAQGWPLPDPDAT